MKRHIAIAVLAVFALAPETRAQSPDIFVEDTTQVQIAQLARYMEDLEGLAQLRDENNVRMAEEHQRIARLAAENTRKFSANIASETANMADMQYRSEDHVRAWTDRMLELQKLAREGTRKVKGLKRSARKAAGGLYAPHAWMSASRAYGEWQTELEHLEEVATEAVETGRAALDAERAAPDVRI
ncbi:MAG: hypothetical protein F4Y00_06205 [Bacteroidetes bacterium SB0662_bin_6]|nr:hypothetical protein [Bacteroidetes bacterium SB0668_bin_1]MYE04545.1 hypothetical protein [Bacteroidetes bacterium SB0662_bin_6]